MDVQALREQFPTLRADEPLTYLDNACVTLRPDSVINAILDYYTKQPACAGRSPHRWGTAVTQMVSRTRRKVGAFIGAQPSGVVFMRNTTEAIVNRYLEEMRGHMDGTGLKFPPISTFEAIDCELADSSKKILLSLQA